MDSRTDNYWAVRIAERFEQSLSKTAKWWQALEYLPQASDLGNYLLNAELGIESAVNSRLSMRLSLKNTYDSEPGAGLEKNDLTVVGGVGIKLH